MRVGFWLILAGLAAAALGGWAFAQEATPEQAESPSPFHSLATGLGIITEPNPPPDFVRESRPAKPAAEIPVFTPPDEPPAKPKSAKEIEAIDNDLESIAKRHDALRAAYPPSAKAVAAEAAEKKAKSKPKPAPTLDPPAQ